MTTSNLNVAHTSGEVSSQLNLPSGPLGIVRPRRERTDEDGRWYTDQFKVDHDRPVDSAVYMRLAYYGSLNVGRLAYPSMARLARECSHIHVRTAQRAIRRLEARGVVKCLNRKGGHRPGTYLVVGGGVVPTTADCRARGDRMPPNDIREGKREVRTKDPSLSVSIGAQTIDPGAVEESLTTDTAQTIDPALLEKVEKQIGVDCLPFFPSQKQEQEQKASAPVPEETVFVNENQVKMLFKLQRKLGYEANDEQARVFDGLEHADRKRILDKLLAEEQLAAAQGKVTAPPKAEPSPRHKFPLPVARNKVRERPACTEHRWTPPAEDGVRNCYDCDEEQLGEVSE